MNGSGGTGWKWLEWGRFGEHGRQNLLLDMVCAGKREARVDLGMSNWLTAGKALREDWVRSIDQGRESGKVLLEILSRQL